MSVIWGTKINTLKKQEQQVTHGGAMLFHLQAFSGALACWRYAHYHKARLWAAEFNNICEGKYYCAFKDII